VLGRRHAAGRELGEAFGGEGREDVVGVIVVQDDAIGSAEGTADRREDDLGEAVALRGGQGGGRGIDRRGPSLRSG
jgi:hypothetical protein